MRILGIDIGNGTAVCCPLDALPSEPRKFNLDREKFYHFKADCEGLKGLLELNPDICVLEPSGVNYAKVWMAQLSSAGIEVRLVGHRQCNAHREHLDLPDKEDETDAFVLAHYGWTNLDNPKKFNQVRGLTITRIREIVLRLEHLNRAASPVVNRLRQDLAWMFPEVSKQTVKLNGEIPPLFFRWLAGNAKSKRYDGLYLETIGLGLQDSARLHALRICDLYEEEIALELELKALIQDEQFKPYMRVFNKFGLGLRTSGIIISQIYPFANFLDEDGKPVEVWTKPRKQTVEARLKAGWGLSDAGKKTLKHLSLRRFEKMLGIAPTERSSGMVNSKKIAGGASLCRKALWRWVYTRVETVKFKLSKNFKISNPIDLDLYLWMNHSDRQKKPIKILRMKVAAKITRLLFHELLDELSK